MAHNIARSRLRRPRMMSYPLRIGVWEHEDGIYSIGAVARMLGLRRATIRNWEERYAIVRPQRSDGGHRLFSRQDVERLRFVAAQVSAGVSPVEAHRLLRAHLQAGGGPPTEQAEETPAVLILLAERDPLAAQLIEFFLRTEGYQVTCEFAAEDALVRYTELRPQIAIIDLLISGGGYALCRELKEQGLGVLIALSTLATLEAALTAGADAFLRKPVDPLRLVSTVKDLLGTSALARTQQAIHG